MTLRPGSRAVRCCPLLSGAVLSVGGAGPDYQPVRGAAAGTLHVIAGPDAGFGVALRPGRYFIGRAPEAHVCLHDVDVSRTHALVEVSAEGGAVLTDAGSRNGTWVNGTRVTAPTALDACGLARLGNDTLRWAPGAMRTLRVLQTADGRLEFDRGAAAPPVIQMQPIIPAQEVQSPQRERWRKKRRRAIDEARAAARERLAVLVAEEERIRHLLAPGPAEVTAMAAGARPDLWSRDPRSPSGLMLRVGVTDQTPSVRLRGTPGNDLEVPDLQGVPVTVDLRETGLFCVIGTGEPATALLRWLIVQLATFCSPDDLRIVLLTASGDDQNDG
ncbi:MAG: FHA domain-containing protein, partial [Trebonia sp.]